jgi:monoamine oxidase
MQSTTCDVAIIGGGLAGLTAARTLTQADIDFQLFESAAKLGGRIQSVRNPQSGEAMADLGPTWIWPPYQAAVSGLIREMGVTLFDQYETGNAVLDINLNTPPRQQFLPGQHGMSRIVGGPQAIIDGLVATVPAAQMHLSHALVDIAPHGDGFSLRFKNPALPNVTATRVIAAAPLRLMQETVSWHGILDDATLSIMRNSPTWMATQAKVAILFEQPFWRARGLSGRVASQIGPLAEIHDHCSSNGADAALFGFAGVAIGDRQTEPLTQAIREQLVRCFGDDAAKPTAIEIKDWATDNNICAQRDLDLPPQHPEVLPIRLRQGFHRNKLALAVAETAAQHPGLIDGAIEAGQRAASQILKG